MVACIWVGEPKRVKRREKKLNNRKNKREDKQSKNKMDVLTKELPLLR